MVEINIAAFRLAYPAFADDSLWSDSTVEAALYEGDAETGGCGWGGYADEPSNFKRRGQFLYAAHWLAVTYPNGESSTVGASQLITASKSVGDESISYAAPTAQTDAGDAWLASSSFGQQFMRLRKRVGMGARAV
jgi:hypothetical protein